MLSEVLVIEKENAIMKSNFTFKNDVFWYMSDEEIFNDSQECRKFGTIPETFAAKRSR